MKDKLFTISFSPGPVKRLLAQLAAAFEPYGKSTVKAEHNRIYLPRALGNGFIEYRELFNGLSCLLCDVTWQQQALLVCPLQKKEHYYMSGCRYGFQQPYFTDTNHTGQDLSIHSDCLFVYSTQLSSSFLFPAGQRQRVYVMMMTHSFAMEELRLAADTPRQGLIQDFIQQQPFSSIIPLPLSVQHRMDQTFEQLSEGPNTTFIHRPALISAAYNLLHQWYLHFFTMEEQQEAYYDTNLQDVIRVKDLYVSDFGAPPLTVEELARMCNMSVTKFKSVFKSMFGMSCYQYYQAQRMEYAKQLLGRQQHPIKEISYMTGFQNTANFTRSFKKAFDILPRDFQKVVRNMEQ
ncbi:AraC family transcriptional regulator [Chitinophaga sp. GbtcB8]|uniref:helix-turn-helix transcriptional regulator n=1 Tax=Chitinophaga sp. GbtcB8 TaxID=2824753 RepID=UPI001C30F70F|nr:AraC family transcriptional regulator [Chitinophaga sp. GbtcB8]